MSLKIKLSWQKKAVVLFACTLVILSITLTIWALREAEREKLIKENEIRAEQQRAAELLIDEIKSRILETEEAFVGLPWDDVFQRGNQRLIEACRRIIEENGLIRDIFLIDQRNEILFPLVTGYFPLAGDESVKPASPSRIEKNPIFKRAEAAEYRSKNYRTALKSYQSLIATTSDPVSRARLLNCIARCYEKLEDYGQAVMTYQKILENFPEESSLDGIPLGIIAQYQVGEIYYKLGQEAEGTEVFFDFYRGLLQGKWALTRSQFFFHWRRTLDRLESSLSEIRETQEGMGLFKGWEELQNIEAEKVREITILETLNQRIIPLLESRLNQSMKKPGEFFHFSEIVDNVTYLIPYTSTRGFPLLGFRIDEKVLIKNVIPTILDRLHNETDWCAEITDEAGNHVVGEIVSDQNNPEFQLAYSTGFNEDFPPWNVSVFQTKPGAAERQYKMRRNIYLLSVAVVMAALFLGGFFSIKGTAKELKLARLKSEFVSTVSHEFRTPLTSIRYLSEMLQRGRVDGEQKKQQYYETLTNESERLSRLVENILDFSKIEAGMKEYQFKDTDIGQLAGEVLAGFRAQIIDKKVRLESEIEKQLPVLKADRKAISRVLFNLLDNAVKYSDKGKTIWLRARSQGENIFLEVEDEGIGIKEEEQNRIFEKFYRSEDILDKNIEGSGIGLTLVDHIVKAHGGEVLLESRKGQGTKVIIKLPVGG
ncbi:ATP-binding protein [Acidobacteriota bacterium]